MSTFYWEERKYGYRVTMSTSTSVRMVQSWGVASARHTSATLVYAHHGNDDSEYLFDVPIGPSITRWDIRTGERSSTFQAHSDAVTSMRLSPDHEWVATACYSGGVKLWDPQWSCVDETKAPIGCQHHLAWSHDSKRFIVIGIGPNSSIVMYDIITSTNEGGPPTIKLQLAWQVKAGHADPPQTTTSNSPEATKDDQYVNAFYMGEMTSTGCVLAVEEQTDRATTMQLFDGEGRLLRMSSLPPVKSGGVRVETLYMSECHNGCYALGVQGGRVLIVRDDLTVTATINVGVTSRTCLWDEACLVLPTDSGSLVWWSTEGSKVKEVKIGSPDIIVRLDWSVSRTSLWVCGFSALRLLKVDRDEQGVVSEVATSHVVNSHEISCCGVDFSPSGRSLASGDLVGNVWVTEGTEVKTAFKCNVGGSVRCLVWRCEDVIIVGGLDGQVTQCQVGGACKSLIQLEGSVITMKLNNSRQLLAIGTSEGMLEVYNCSEDTLKVVSKVLAHPPKQGPQDKRFGQLTKQAEVWSVCWSPGNERLATCSEDQTTKVWDTSDWKCITTLTGHTMAVTSVAWKDAGALSLIATCSDDRTVRLSDGESYQLLRVLNTMEIYGWHTLTYLTFHPAKDSPLLLCTTQNGHVVVWDALSGQGVVRGKIHLGSIEGLVWCEGRCGAWAVTVGADCVVNMFSIDC